MLGYQKTQGKIYLIIVQSSLIFRVCSILKDNLPVNFKDKNFYNNLDDSSKKWLQNLLKNLNMVSGSSNNVPNRPGSVPFGNENPYNMNMSSPNSFANFTNYEPYYLNNPYSLSNPYYMYDNKK